MSCVIEIFIPCLERNSQDAVSTCLQSDQIFDPLDRPYPEYFMEYLPDFLLDNPHGTECSEAGHPSYGDAVKILYDESAVAVNGSYNYTQSRVGANYWMGYHTILK